MGKKKNKAFRLLLMMGHYMDTRIYFMVVIFSNCIIKDCKRFKVVPHGWGMGCDMLLGKVEVNGAREIRSNVFMEVLMNYMTYYALFPLRAL